MRIGQGWDLHRLEPGRKLILGGVHIPFERGCIAHSDGDVLVHAVIDAILGAAALGDIGSHFPDTSDKWKDADSLVLLTRTVKLISEAGYRIINLDTTVILEQPKLRPFINDIISNIAAAAKIRSADVSVKAKTSEKVNAAGEGRAVEAFAVVLLGEVN